MGLVGYKDLCIDAANPAKLGIFWASALGLRFEEHADGDVVLRGKTLEQTVWVNTVHDPKTVKNRVHLDLYAASLTPFEGLRALSTAREFAWNVFADPEGGEFCVFIDDEPRENRLKDIVVDAVEPSKIAAWWAEMFGAEAIDDGDYSYVSGIAGAPFEDLDFVPVPEAKAVKNRVHFDVRLTAGHTIDELVRAGATVLHAEDFPNSWTVMADPEDNEFCVFAPS